MSDQQNLKEPKGPGAIDRPVRQVSKSDYKSKLLYEKQIFGAISHLAINGWEIWVNFACPCVIGKGKTEDSAWKNAYETAA